MKYPIFIILSLLIFSNCAQKQNEKEKVDLIITNTLLYNSDGSTTETDIAVIDDKIVAINNNLSASYSTTNTIDAKGKFTMPGLIDAHAHLQSIGRSLSNINLLGVPSWEESLQLVEEKVKTAEPGEWITGRGWHQDKWTDQPSKSVDGYPAHDDLSKISPNNPVILSHASGHGILVNAKAMELAGITSNTKSPKGGLIVKDENGNPIGIFQENAEYLISKIYTQQNEDLTEKQILEQKKKYVQLANQECIRQGITSLHDAGISLSDFQFYKNLAKTDQLKIRLYSMLSSGSLQNATTEELNEIKSYNHPFFKCNSVKAFVDGALGSRGAWLLEDYSDKPNYRGENVTSLESLTKTAKICKENGFQLCIHAIGDRGNREVVTIFENVMGSDLEDARWRIEHAQHLNSKEIERIGDLDIIASMQTVHCTSDSPYVEKRLGQERAEEGAYVWQKLLANNVHIANGTDAPIENVNPFDNLYAAVTRKRIGSDEAFYPDQVLSRNQALQSYTNWNAYASFQEEEKGSIEVGKLADIIILDRNLLTCAPEQILDTKVLYTIVGGDIVYESVNK